MYSMTSEVTKSVKSVAKNALVVSLCYRGQDNYVKGEGTLKDIDIISGVLHNKFGYQGDEIKVLTEAEATKANFIKAVENMIASGSKTNFVYFVGHGYSVKNLNEGDNDREPNDSGIVLWDGYLLDDDLCRLVARFGKNTRNLFMFAECYSGGVLDYVNFKLRSHFQDFFSKVWGSQASYHLSLWNLLPATFSLP